MAGKAMSVSIRTGDKAKSDRYGYTHWSKGAPLDDLHSLKLVPQSIADGWQGFCSCGEWIAFASFYEFNDRDTLLDAIKREHQAHVDGLSAP